MKLLSDGPDFHYVVRLDPDVVCARLADAIGAEDFFNDDDREFVGRVSARVFRIRRNSTVQNAFRPYLYGSVEPDLLGSRIAVRLGLHPSTKVFVVVWLGAMLLIGLAVLVLFLTENLAVTPRGLHPRKILLAPPLMFAGCIAAAWIGRILGRGEEDRLLRFADGLWGPRVDPDYSRSR
jgi:hypothetical protein